MGKKSKTKKPTKKLRRKQLDYLKSLDHAYGKFVLKLDTIPKTKYVERRMLLEEQIQILEQSKELYFAHNGYKYYWGWMVRLHELLFSIFVHSQNYSAALDVCRKQMLQFSSKVINKTILAPYIDLFLLRVDKSKHDLHKDIIVEVATIINEAIDNNNIEEQFISFQNFYISKCFFELSRLQMYEAVKYLANDMREADRRINRNFPMDQGAIFFLFSLVDELRFDILDHGASKNELFQIARNNCNSMLSSKCDPLPYGEVFMGSSILGYYATFYLREKSSSIEVEEYCIEAMTKYLDFKSSQISNRCCTCHEADADRLMLCQGCRAVSFCCKDCQRLNYVHHEETGTKGLGHKYLCPVFKAYHKRKNNTDDSKKDHLERKFHRACKRFLVGTLQSVGKKRVKCLVTFKTQDYL